MSRDVGVPLPFEGGGLLAVPGTSGQSKVFSCFQMDENEFKFESTSVFGHFGARLFILGSIFACTLVATHESHAIVLYPVVEPFFKRALHQNRKSENRLEQGLLDRLVPQGGAEGRLV